jgi:hypothetical protein
MRLFFKKVQVIVGEIFFLRYMNSVGSEIDRYDLICASDIFPSRRHELYQLSKK